MLCVRDALLLMQFQVVSFCLHCYNAMYVATQVVILSLLEQGLVCATQSNVWGGGGVAQQARRGNVFNFFEHTDEIPRHRY